MNILVVGYGRVGQFISEQLIADGHRVNIVDIDGTVTRLDATNFNDTVNYVKGGDFNLAVNCVPGSVGYEVLENIISCGLDVVDVSFMPENVLALDELAKKKDVAVLADMGLAPGMPGIILGHYNKQSPVRETYIEVGGVPVDPRAPYFYHAEFSPRDVIEEYIRPANYRVSKFNYSSPPLEELVVSRFGEQYTAICTDGLRTLLETKPGIAMMEVTTRHHGHIEIMQAMEAAGCFKSEHIDDTADALIKAWCPRSTDRDKILYHQSFLFEDGSAVAYEMTYVGDGGWSAMSKTTGLVACAAVGLIKDGMSAGVHGPDYVGEVSGALRHILDYHKRNGVIYRRVT